MTAKFITKPGDDTTGAEFPLKKKKEKHEGRSHQVQIPLLLLHSQGNSGEVFVTLSFFQLSPKDEETKASSSAIQAKHL